jgi:cell division septation protein DedD
VGATPLASAAWATADSGTGKAIVGEWEESVETEGVVVEEPVPTESPAPEPEPVVESTPEPTPTETISPESTPEPEPTVAPPGPQSYVVTVEVVVNADDAEQAVRLLTSELEEFMILSTSAREAG